MLAAGDPLQLGNERAGGGALDLPTRINREEFIGWTKRISATSTSSGSEDSPALRPRQASAGRSFRPQKVEKLGNRSPTKRKSYPDIFSATIPDPSTLAWPPNPKE